MYFDDTEIFRTSTAEPTRTGIEWTYRKDMSSYLSLFKKPQKIIFDLGNLVDDIYTGTFNVTLTAIFFTDAFAPSAADLILPVSARRSSVNGSSAFVIPTDNATTTLDIPINTKKAIFTISACGQLAEEFWYSNVPSSATQTFPATELSGHSPFREVQVYIDGILAGVAWPFPVIFTGGIVPSLWRPVVGIDTYDLKEDEIDIMPFVPLLVDGKGHVFEIRIVGVEDDGTGGAILSDDLDSYWVVTGKLFLWQDDELGITAGPAPVVVAPEPALHVSFSSEEDITGANETLIYNVSVERYLSVSTVVVTPHGLKSISWQQTLTFTNIGTLTSGGSVQVTHQRTIGLDVSSNNYSRTFAYPLFVNSSFSIDDESGNFSIAASIRRGKEMRVFGLSGSPSTSLGRIKSDSDALPALTGTHLKTTQNGSATYFASPRLKYAVSYGTTEQNLVFSSSEGYQPPLRGQQTYGPERDYRFYRRHVLAANGTLIEDHETTRKEQGEREARRASQGDSTEHVVREGVGRMLGRGPRF